VLAVLLSACNNVAGFGPGGSVTLRLGYFPNLTHATALVGVKNGFFQDALGAAATLDTHTFNAGGDAVTAILSGSIDAAFIGPNPTTNAYAQSRGKAVRVIAGATSGGALLVVRPTITSDAQLRGTKIADPQLGGSQDVALRWYLRSHGFKFDTAGGGDVSIVPEDNAQTLTAFRQGQIDGAWVPEPWASRLIVEGGGHILVDERDLWPQGRFVTTNLVVSTSFLRTHPAQVRALLEGVFAANQFLEANPEQAQRVTNEAVTEITGKKLADGVVSGAWAHMDFTLEPLSETLRESAAHAHAVGLLPEVDLAGLYDLGPLNQVLRKHNQPELTAA
jgi:NitT/TauT family transport system substrate-binding protein